MRRILRVAAWNVALAAAGLALIAAAGELYLRARPDVSFWHIHIPARFVPGVGLMWQPNEEVRLTNSLDYWQTARTNSLGFLDREPLSPQDAADACHVAAIGDSFVQAWEVPIADKFHIRLEELAAQRLPALGVAASAYGKSGTGQVSQIPYYDHFARALRPNLIVLVFVSNDFRENSPILEAAYRYSWIPGKSPYAHAVKLQDGSIALRPPDADYEAPRVQRAPDARQGPTFMQPVRNHALSVSYFANWLSAKQRTFIEGRANPRFAARVSELSQLPCCENILDGWTPARRADIDDVFRRESLPPVFQDAVDYTAFALDEWKARAARDGATLVILSSYTMGSRGDPLFDRMSAMAQERGLPVIDQHAYIKRQGHKIEDAHFQHDAHWNADGHLWAAEALMEWIERNQDVCGDE